MVVLLFKILNTRYRKEFFNLNQNDNKQLPRVTLEHIPLERYFICPWWVEVEVVVLWHCCILIRRNGKCGYCPFEPP